MQFEKDTGEDPFNVDQFLSEVQQGTSTKRYGLQDDEPRAAKRVRVEDNEP